MAHFTALTQCGGGSLGAGRIECAAGCTADQETVNLAFVSVYQHHSAIATNEVNRVRTGSKRWRGFEDVTDQRRSNDFKRLLMAR